MGVIRKAFAAWASVFGAREYLLFLGLALLAYGCSLVWWPLMFIVPGAIVSAVAIFGTR